MKKTEYKLPLKRFEEAKIKPVKGAKIRIQTKSGGTLKPATITEVEKDFVIVTVEE